MHIHTHAHTHVHIHSHTYTCTHMHTHMYIYTHIHTHAHTCTHTCTHTLTHAHTWTHTHTYTHTLTYIHMHTHTHILSHTCTYTCIHTHPLSHSQLPHKVGMGIWYPASDQQRRQTTDCIIGLSKQEFAAVINGLSAIIVELIQVNTSYIVVIIHVLIHVHLAYVQLHNYKTRPAILSRQCLIKNPLELPWIGLEPAITVHYLYLSPSPSGDGGP